MASLVNKIVAGAIGLTVLFLLATTMIMPFFSTAWRFCAVKTWEGANSSASTANCTTMYAPSNTSFVDPSTGTHTELGETNVVDTDNSADVDNFCLNCSTPGGFRTTVQGLVLLVLVLALIGFGIKYLPKR